MRCAALICCVAGQRPLLRVLPRKTDDQTKHFRAFNNTATDWSQHLTGDHIVTIRDLVKDMDGAVCVVEDL